MIKGLSGFGKTRILDAFTGFNEENIWSFKINKINEIITVKNNKTINSLIAYCPQETKLFELSLIDNLKLGLNVEVQKVYQLMEHLNIVNLINRHKDNKELNLTLDKFSGGEMKKLGIIRNFLRDKEIEVYDEPTAYLDRDSANAVIKFLQERAKNKIILVASHDEDLEKISGRIINLNKIS